MAVFSTLFRACQNPANDFDNPENSAVPDPVDPAGLRIIYNIPNY
jgi:hypothetical protein